MKTLQRATFLVLPLLIASLFSPARITAPRQVFPSPTPTYDPLAEPPLPEHPTEYELGRNLYWHWCMTCHGDRGQGLTDEFRLIWPADHQNCWDRGCHGGRREDQGFPIPTVVPALVNDACLARFESMQELADFLQATHPPQSPGILTTEEYRAIALFVLTLDTSSPAALRASVTPVARAGRTVAPAQDIAANSARSPAYSIVLLVACAVCLLLLMRRRQIQGKDKPS